MNAIAGAYAEHVPVVHIAGSPSTLAQKDHRLVHHTLGNGDFAVFGDMYKSITVAQARIHSLSTATSQIDLVLRTCMLERRPVYIELPTDMVARLVPAAGLGQPLDLSLPANDPQEEQHLITTIIAKLREARQPVLLIDGNVERFGATELVNEIVRTLGYPTFVTPMGKSVVDESLPNFSGVYAGSGSFDDVRAFVEESDLVLAVGILKSDFNTTGFTFHLSRLQSIEIHQTYTQVGLARYEAHALALAAGLGEALRAAAPMPPKPQFTSDDHARAEVSAGVPPADYPADVITHSYLWPTLSTWLKPGDVILTETGTPYVGIWEATLPKGAKVISQTLWGSIGYTLPAAQGAALAVRELDADQPASQKRRVILFEGDGSAQVTAQAIGTILRLGLDIIIILINNDGYTIERWVHGMHKKYNDVPRWRYTMLPEAMGAANRVHVEASKHKDGEERHGRARTRQIRDRSGLEGYWRSDEAVDANGNGMQFVEIFMPKEDAPLALKLIAAKTNAG